MNSKNHASINDNMYWTNQVATQKEGDICGGCFSPDTNFDCGKCVEGLECVKDPGSALLQDLPSKCRKPSGNIVLCLRILQKISSFWIYFRLLNQNRKNFLPFSANLEICQDDQNWVDSKFGDGLGKCKDMTLDWCENQGNYSIEAKRACPKACKVCKGEFYDLIYFLKRTLYIEKWLTSKHSNSQFQFRLS